MEREKAMTAMAAAATAATTAGNAPRGCGHSQATAAQRDAMRSACKALHKHL